MWITWAGEKANDVPPAGPNGKRLMKLAAGVVKCLLFDDFCGKILAGGSVTMHCLMQRKPGCVEWNQSQCCASQLRSVQRG